MSGINDGINLAMAELNIDPSSLDDGSDLETETESKEAESEVKEEVVDAVDEFSDDDSDETAPEGEEKEVAPIEASEEVIEEPKLTAKEFQELHAAKVELEAKEKALTDQRVSMEKEFQEKYHDKVKTHDQMDDFFANLAQKDPDLFDLLKTEFQAHQEKYTVLDQFRKETDSLRQELNQFKSKASDEVTLTKLDAEMEKFNSSLGKEAETAGLKIDRKAIEEMWAKGLTVNEAFYAKYGEAFTKASASKAKLETATKKVAARPTVSTAGNVSRTNASTEKSFKGMDTRDVLSHFARQLTGKVS